MFLLILVMLLSFEIDSNFIAHHFLFQIRLHILAMHELCEYTRGEGFSEGFDAHLNIEQMNKTSVELFQLYDDHRKRGINVETEREFRGYYALLKLDKHPGYKVSQLLSIFLNLFPSVFLFVEV